jgi:DNA-binding transcriptional regulator YiaG
MKEMKRLRGAEIISRVIRSKHLNQKQIAAALNVSTSTVSAWSKGAPIPPVKTKMLIDILKEVKSIRGTKIIAKVIKSTNLNQKQIAAALSVSTSTVSAWSKGAPIPRSKTKMLTILLEEMEQFKKAISHEHSEWLLFIETDENANNWLSYMRSLGVSLHPKWREILLDLNDIGVLISKKPPTLIEIDSSNVQITGDQKFNESTDDGDYLSIDIDIQDYKQHTPFDNLVVELLANLNTLEKWCDTFLPKNKEGELTLIAQKIKNRLVDVSFLNEKVVDLIEKMGTNSNQLIRKNNEIRKEVITLIRDLCEELLKTGKSIKTDYFEFVKLHPDRLRKRIDQYEIRTLTIEPNINDYLRYGEIKIAKGVEQTLDLQKKILSKVETLTKTQSELVERIQKNEKLLEQILKEE